MKEVEEEEPGLVDKVKEYIRIRKDLAMLMIADKASQAAGGLISGAILIFLGFFVFLFANFGLGYYLSEIIGNSYAGFFIVAGIYLLIAIIVLLVKENSIEKPFANRVIKKILAERNESIYEKQN
ncbi:phage holin family protein [Daejeonella oryzae]|uniref:phage holin family protein n=1 Tax=Daejeonella oryzae TaxID=1122943 RepID=UPI00040B573C|nr:phage holin family protein [Daejeonella oryzae]